MGGKPDPPAPPDYTPFIKASESTAKADAEAARIQADVAREQMAKQDVYAQRAADLGDRYAQMAQDQATYGKQQYEDVKGYLQKYMESQLGYQTVAEENLKAQTEAARLSGEQAKISDQRATETYNRYMGTYAPMEDRFAKEAFAYASPARMEEDAAAARGDVAAAFTAQEASAKRQLMSYGVDPSQGAYAGRTQAMDISKAASMAAAGTMARRQTEQQGKQYQLAALEVGQKLPAQAIGEANLGMGQTGLGLNQTASGLGGSAIGGAGIGAGTNLLQAGTGAMGSPTSYAALNPYTNLTGTYGTQSTGLYGNQISALGNIGSVINAGAGALNNSYSNQMSNYQARSQQAAAPWQAIGQIAGIGLGFGLGKPGPTRIGSMFG